MKKLIYALTAILILSFSAQHTAAAPVTDKVPVKESPMTDAQKEARVHEISRRVEAIKAIDRSKLSREQRKELRNELKELKKEARAVTGGGIYLSVGAILLIILALIILL